MRILEGFIECPVAFLVVAEVLEQRYLARIAGHQVVITLPPVDMNAMDVERPPLGEPEWHFRGITLPANDVASTRADGPLWGYVTHRAGNGGFPVAAEVRRLRTIVEADTDDAGVRMLAEDIARGAPGWWQSVAAWIEVGFCDGWDSFAALVDGRWVDRQPRRPEVAEQLLRETQLMPWLAPLLPLRVPIPWILDETPLLVRHVLVPGHAITAPDVGDGLVIGRFLRALHEISPAAAGRHGLAPAAETHRSRVATISRFRDEVMPLIPAAQRDSALALLDAVQEFPIDTIVHGDFGPDHVLVDDGRVTGVIDFGDVHLGDAANDLAWPLYGAPTDVADAVATSYGVTGDLRDRALVWHQLGPWHEVTHGLDIGDPDTVQRGLNGVLARLNPPGR